MKAILLSAVLMLTTTACGRTETASQSDTENAPLQPATRQELPAFFRPNPQRVWEKTWPEPISALSLASSGGCMAVAGASVVTVVDSSGDALWHWDFPNKYIAASNVAVSSACDWLIVAGDSSYKYVWSVHRNGTAVSLKMEGTPLGVAINHRGDRFVAGTGGGVVAMFSTDGKQLWKKAFGLAESLRFSEDDSRLAVLRWGVTGLMTEEGAVLWKGAIDEMKPSADFTTFVGSKQPPHFRGWRTLSLLDADGTELWTKISGRPDAVLSPDGGTVAALIADDQNFKGEDPMDEPLSLVTLSRSGEVRKRSSVQDSPLAVAPEGHQILVRNGERIRCIDDDGNELWSLPDSVSYPVSITDDLRSLVVHSSTQIQWYSLR